MRRVVRDLTVLLSVAVVAVAVPVVVNHTVGRGGVQIHGPVVSYERPWFHGIGSNGLDALLNGQLELSGGCLLLSGDAVLWPSRTRWDDNTQVLELPHGKRARLGDELSGGGGSFGGLGDHEWAASPAGRALAHCQAPGTEVKVFNTDENVDVRSGSTT